MNGSGGAGGVEGRIASSGRAAAVSAPRVGFVNLTF